MLPWAPRYGVGEAEVPFEATFAGIKFFGYIDSVCGFNNLIPHALDGDPCHMLVTDYKTSSDPTQYGLSQEQLTIDPGMTIYAWAAYQAGATLVTCRLAYVRTSGSPKVTIVDAVMKKDDVMARMAVIAAECNQGQIWFNEQRDPNTLSKNTEYCNKFSTCPFYDLCEKPSSEKMVMKKGRLKVMNDFDQQLDEVTGTVANAGPAPAAPPNRKLPPPLPSKKTPPPLPPKPPAINQEQDIDDVASKFQGATPPVEKGYVNAPEGYSEAAESPEHAKIIQNIPDPAPVVEPEDEFTGLELHQLKAEAVRRGLSFSPRARIKSMLELLRADQAAKEAEGQIDYEHPSEPPAGSLAFEPKNDATEPSAPTAEPEERFVDNSPKGIILNDKIDLRFSIENWDKMISEMSVQQLGSLLRAIGARMRCSVRLDVLND